MKHTASIRVALTLLVVFAIVITQPIVGFGEIPHQINYQGHLTDDSGTPLKGTYEMRFALYSAETGGSMLWNHIPDSHFVTVSEGVFNVQLGSLNPLPTTIFVWAPVYLEIYMYNSDTESWEAFVPRQPLTSVPYAFRSEMATEAVNASNATYADTLDGFDSTAFAASNHGHVFSELFGLATDDQIPDTITVDHASNAANADYAINSGNADTLDGADASAFATTGHNHDTRYYSQVEVNAIISSLEARIAALEDKLQHFNRNGNDITISGANLHIVSGSGSTDGWNGSDYTVNGLGNLIIGYDEERPIGEESCSLGMLYKNETDCVDADGLWWLNEKGGSHNLVIGFQHNYSSFGGLVAGNANTISKGYANVSGGINNTASNYNSSVSGGVENTASGWSSSVSGGAINTASGGFSSVSGGYNNTASGYYSSVGGGSYSTASGYYASVSGGSYNTASGENSFVGGGGGPYDHYGNIAFANYSTILGGRANGTGDVSRIWGELYNTVIPGTDHNIGMQSSVSSGYSNIASGRYSSVSSGYSNTASGVSSSVSGGSINEATKFSASVTGGRHNTADGNDASISGGGYNIARGNNSFVGGGGGELPGHGNLAWSHYSVVLGGASNEAGDTLDENHASGSQATVSGGFGNKAQGSSSSVSGGKNNETRAGYASVSGGEENIASGMQSSVSGGRYGFASGDWANVSGGRENTASGAYASVTGGQLNEASGIDASVSGGYNGTAAVDYHDWQAGSTFIYDHSEQP